jgi:predicted phage terminase large subunit-like protein
MTQQATLPVSRAEAASELLSRRQARKDLIAFTEFTLPNYAAVAHHYKIAEALHRVVDGASKRLMIFMPPRHGKSELASKRFPAWYIGQYPDREIICASYAQELANEFGRNVRNTIGSQEFRAVFGNVELAPDSSAANRWHTSYGGSYVAAGVGGAITGRGADLLVIDDPIKNREDADSEIYRDRVWDWYRSTAYTRLMPGGAIVLIQTRWHDDDLAGRLLQAQEDGGDQWEVIELEAIADGKALWPEWYDLDALEGIRNTIGPREWSALYQQQPTPDEGDFFKKAWIRTYQEAPSKDLLTIYGASDYAVTADDGDYTVHGVIGVDGDDNIFLLDWWRGQTESHEWVEAVIDMMERWKPRQWGEENGQIIKSIGPFLQQRMHERRVYCHREQYASAADKPTRARSIQARMAMGKVYFPTAEWSLPLKDELLRFPTGRHDDQVDVLSLMGRMLDVMVAGKVVKSKENRRGMTGADLDRRERLAKLGISSKVGYYGTVNGSSR